MKGRCGKNRQNEMLKKSTQQHENAVNDQIISELE
jgi:hypothetical protein